MEFSPDAWELTTAAVKLPLYLGISGILGGLFMVWLAAPGRHLSSNPLQSWLRPYLFLSAAAVLASAALFFLLQVGAINQQGPGGMLDLMMAGLLAQTGVGYGSALRAGIPLLLVLFLLTVGRVGKALPTPLLLLLLAAVPLGASFGLLGHVAALDGLARVAIALHVAAMAIWVGSLPLLYRLCRRAPLEELKSLMEHFGLLAMIPAALLVLAGLLLVLALLVDYSVAGLPSRLTGSVYELSLLLKLLLVGGLLSVAALNRFRLVPALMVDGPRRLMLAIRLEMVLALLILVLTAWLSTLVGPGP